MKKLILVVATVAFTTLTAFSIYSPSETVQDNGKIICNYGQCSKMKEDGYRCKNCCQQYSSYCWSHSK